MKLSVIDGGQLTVFVRSLASEVNDIRESLDDQLKHPNHSDLLDTMINEEVMTDVDNLGDDIIDYMESVKLEDDWKFVPINTVDLVFLDNNISWKAISKWIEEINNLTDRFYGDDYKSLTDPVFNVLIHSRSHHDNEFMLSEFEKQNTHNIIIVNDPLLYFKSYTTGVGVAYFAEDKLAPEFILWDRRFLAEELAARKITLPDDITITQ